MADEQNQNISDKDSASSYFLVGESENNSSVYGAKIKQFFGVVQYGLIQIWPAVNRTINTIMEFLIRLIKGIITIAIEQIRNFRGGE